MARKSKKAKAAEATVEAVTVEASAESVAGAEAMAESMPEIAPLPEGDALAVTEPVAEAAPEEPIPAGPPVLSEGTHEVSEGEVVARGACRVILRGSAKGTASMGARVDAFDVSKVCALEGACVFASGAAEVEAFPGSDVRAYGHVRVIVHEGAKVRIYDHATAVPYVAPPPPEPAAEPATETIAVEAPIAEAVPVSATETFAESAIPTESAEA